MFRCFAPLFGLPKESEAEELDAYEFRESKIDVSAFFETMRLLEADYNSFISDYELVHTQDKELHTILYKKANLMCLNAANIVDLCKECYRDPTKYKHILLASDLLNKIANNPKLNEFSKYYIHIKYSLDFIKKDCKEIKKEAQKCRDMVKKKGKRDRGLEDVRYPGQSGDEYSDSDLGGGLL